MCIRYLIFSNCNKNEYFMNIIDYISIAIIFISAIISFFRGFFQEIMSVFVWVIGIYIYFKYYHFFSFFSVYVYNKIIRYMINFIIFFIFLFLVKLTLNYVITIFLCQFHLSMLNQILGIFFGIVRGTFIVCTILFFLEFSTFFVHSKFFKNSLLIPYYNYFIKIFLKLFIKSIFM